jgi:hypothetical protein
MIEKKKTNNQPNKLNIHFTFVEKKFLCIKKQGNQQKKGKEHCLTMMVPKTNRSSIADQHSWKLWFQTMSLNKQSILMCACNKKMKKNVILKIDLDFHVNDFLLMVLLRQKKSKKE